MQHNIYLSPKVDVHYLLEFSFFYFWTPGKTSVNGQALELIDEDNNMQ